MEKPHETRARANRAKKLALKSLETAKGIRKAILREDRCFQTAEIREWREAMMVEFRGAMFRYRMSLKLARQIRERL